jgi:16S rRNA processing protein RimM
MPAKSKPGSPESEPLFLVIGFLRRSHGTGGEMLMDLHTDFPDRIVAGREVFLGERHTPAKIESVRDRAGGLLVKLRGFESPESVARLRNQWVYVRAEDVPPLPAGRHYKYELLGMRVTDDTGREIGELVEILETGANDVYVIRDSSGKETLLPAIPQVILDYDPAQRSMKVHLLEGL